MSGSSRLVLVSALLAAGAAVVVALVFSGGRSTPTGAAAAPVSTTPGPPTPTEISLAEGRAGVPSYWFGAVFRGKALEKMSGAAGGGTVSFTYGTSCNAGDANLPGNARDCAASAQVWSFTRAGYLSLLPIKRDCWKAYGQAWVETCGQPFQLLTGRRVIRFYAVKAGAKYQPEAWQKSVAALQRFDRGGGARIPAAVPFACDELIRFTAAERSTLPRVLQPAHCPAP